MNLHALFHLTDVPYVYAENENTLVVRLRVGKNDVNCIKVYYKDRYQKEENYICERMELINFSDLFEYYQAKIKLSEPRFRYYFEIEDNNGDTYFYSEWGIKNRIENFEPGLEGFQFPYICKADIYNEVKWAQESVVYQIFPDRFCRGNQNFVDGLSPWGEEVDGKKIYGGDLKGIIKKIDYLKTLGVDLIYITPIFESTTPHKYNIKNYFKIDPAFGTIDDLKNLVKKCHENGIKIVLDAVFNHSGNDFFAFKDVINNGSCSKYKEWYFIDSFPVDTVKGNYRCFATTAKNMPKFNTENKEVVEFLLNVGRYWIEEADIDGWRLDVCDEVDHAFWRDFRKTVKSIKKDAVIFGEVMHEGFSFLKGEQLDGIMNYPFKHACVAFFAKNKIDAKKFVNLLSEARALYMESINRQMLNLIDCHDTPRFLYEAKEDVRKLMLAVVFQFTYIGIPYIYYGDEVGLSGAHDPYCRRCMIWEPEKQNKEIFDHYKKLIKIRKNFKEIVYGSLIFLIAERNVLVFERRYENNIILVVINNSEKEDSIDLSKKVQGLYMDLYNDETIELKKKLIIGKYGFKILKKMYCY